MSFHSRSNASRHVSFHFVLKGEGKEVPLESCSRHSKVMSKVYGSLNFAGLSWTEILRTWDISVKIIKEDGVR